MKRSARISQWIAEIAAEQYPQKGYLGECSRGELPQEALRKFERTPHFSLVSQSAAASTPVSTAFEIAGLRGTETQLQALGFWAVQWMLPRELVFARAILEPRLSWLLEAHQGWLQRMKGVFRTGLGPSWLVQATARGLTGEDSAYRRDSRIEIVLSAAPTDEFLDSWRGLLRDAANPPRSSGPVIFDRFVSARPPRREREPINITWPMRQPDRWQPHETRLPAP